MIRLPDIEDPVFMIKIQYGDTQHYRWCINDYPITVAGDGVYTPNPPLHKIEGHGKFTDRLLRLQWTIGITDPDKIYARSFANRWLYREASLAIRPSPRTAPFTFKVGVCINKNETVSGAGKVLNLTFGSPLARHGSTTKALTNDASQREVLEIDDSMLYTQETIDIIWGSLRNRIPT